MNVRKVLFLSALGVMVYSATSVRADSSGVESVTLECGESVTNQEQSLGYWIHSHDMLTWNGDFDISDLAHDIQSLIVDEENNKLSKNGADYKLKARNTSTKGKHITLAAVDNDGNFHVPKNSRLSNLERTQELLDMISGWCGTTVHMPDVVCKPKKIGNKEVPCFPTSKLTRSVRLWSDWMEKVDLSTNSVTGGYMVVYSFCDSFTTLTCTEAEGGSSGGGTTPGGTGGSGEGSSSFTGGGTTPDILDLQQEEQNLARLLEAF